jgi:hypothetical protein
MNKIDKTTYPNNINDDLLVSEKTQIVLCNSFRKELNHIVRLNNLLNPLKWPHYTIDRYYMSGVCDDTSRQIIIVLSNAGYVNKINDEFYENSFFETINKSDICSLNINKNDIFWEMYPKKQINGLNQLMDKLVLEYNIVNELIEFNTYHKDINKYRGIVYESNFYRSELYQNPLLLLFTNLITYRKEQKKGGV